MYPSITKDAQILAQQSQTPTSPNANTPLLNLPPALRRRIYLDECMNVLARWPAWGGEECAILNLNGPNYIPDPFGYNTENKLGLYGLLVCCRTIYAEVSALLYSSNRFIMRYWEKQSLSPLRALTPSSLSSLTHLKIVLNQASCHYRRPRWYEGSRGECDDERGPGQGDLRVGSELYNAPLDIREPRAKALLGEWQSAVGTLVRHISPQKFELCVVCDVRPDDLETATEILKPLSLLSDLHNCHIRLSRTPSPQLQQMAYNMVLKTRGLALPDGVEKPFKTEAPMGSRLLTLPRELRFRILSYTDLITPWKEVEWGRDCNDDDGKYLVFYPSCRLLDGLSCESHIHHGCQFLNCWPAHHHLSKAGIGCFCQVRHSAVSTTCVCWTPPTALFLVNRSLLHDAQVVFFSGNRFVVHDFRPCLPWSTPNRSITEGAGVSEYHSDQLAASLFLWKKVPHQMLRELRELEFVFPPYAHTGWPGEGHRALAGWAETLRWARDRLNLPGLTLRIVMSDAQGDIEVPPGREEITSDQVEAILSAYRRVASPISILARARSSEDATKLRGFYADVAWPWVWNWDYEDQLTEYGWQWVRDYSRDRYRELREETEMLVLGRDNQTHVSGREQPWRSVWEDRYASRYG